MEYRLIAKRNEIIQAEWEKQREQPPVARLTIKDLAEIFQLPVPTVYRIIKSKIKK